MDVFPYRGAEKAPNRVKGFIFVHVQMVLLVRYDFVIFMPSFYNR